MLNQPMIEKLQSMRLQGLLEAWQGHHGEPKMNELGFDERLGLLIDAEWMWRENKRLSRVLKEAKLKLAQACLEDLRYPARRQLDRALIRQLASCRWVEEHQQVLITGATGVGKTYLACALAQQACRRGFRVLYRRALRLFHELTLSRADGTYPRLLARLARFDVLVIDDLALTPIDELQRQDLLEVLEDRYATRSTIVTSQLSPSRWHERLEKPSSGRTRTSNGSPGTVCAGA